MSISRIQKDAIKQYILDKISIGDNSFVLHTSDAFGISVNSVYRYVKELVSAKQIVKIKNGLYSLENIMKVFVLEKSINDFSDETKIYTDTVYPDFVKNLPDNVVQIWDYAFTEMMNNAIDHSCSQKIICLGIKNAIYTEIIIRDFGIGIFKNIQDWFGFATMEQAIGELFKGKLTTDSQNHSGEGIFYTSRLLDEFAAISDGKIFSHNKYDVILADLNNIEGLKEWENQKGTVILMKLSNNSKKTVNDVFDKFSNGDFCFTKTEIPLKNYFETYPVSRSQAKRLYARMDSFEEIILDFNDVENIGQGFAHELFVVFQNKYPDIKLTCKNANPFVQKMINHVKS